MIIPALAFSLALVSPLNAQAGADAKPVTLARVFAKGEKLQYSVASSLHVEAREYGLQTFIPDDFDLNYKFNTEVRSLKSDGVALLHYQRPNIVEVAGATSERPSKTTVDKINMNYDLTVSPINAILDEKDLSPKKPPAKKKSDDDGGGDGGGQIRVMTLRGRQGPLGGMLGQFVGEVYRLALNVGSMDSAMDFSPKLPLDEVKIGDTWKTTVGYQPQKLKGKDGKQAVQRLDYTFTYKGMVTVNGKKFYRINASLNLSTDLGAFINQLMDAKPEETHLKSIPLTIKQTIDYDLDPVTKRTVAATSKAEGGFAINVTDVTESIHEERLTGTTEMHLVSIGVATPTPVKGHGGR